MICLFAASMLSASGPTYVSDPVVPTLSPPVKDLPPYQEDPDMLGLEMQRRQDYGLTLPDQQGKPWHNPLVDLQQSSQTPSLNSSRVFSTPIVNVSGWQSSSSPPDTTGDVGPNHFLQGINASGGSGVRVFTKSGSQMTDFLLESLASGGNCASGYCDPIVLYDQLADRWLISEFASSGSYFCVYVSQTSDPTGSWYAYQFTAGYSSVPDYPKYGVWPQDDDNDGVYDEGSYLIGVNAGSGGRDVWALDRGKMLQGLAATTQKFTAPSLSAFSFQLFLPAGQEGNDPPPNHTPALFLRPVDTEINSGYSCSPEPCDVMEIWSLDVDWANSSNSDFARLPDAKIAEYDHTLCGTGSTWNCMPQPGTTQKIDPIREPIHFPLQYRNFGSYETLVGCFAEDVDGTDHAAVHWFELRKTTGNWTTYQEGVLGGESGVHRSVCSAAMDGWGNIAVGYTRTGSSTPYYPSIYYSGRLESDTAGTMPYFDNRIQDATNSKTNNERWGDYAGMGVDPVDDCTFWFVTEYGGSGLTKIASFKFDECGCVTPQAPTGLNAQPNGDNSIYLTWSHPQADSETFNVYRAIGTCPQASYELLQSGIGGQTYTDNTASGGVTYAYVVTAVDITGNCESDPSACDAASTTGACTLPPTFAGLQSVTNPQNATCTLDLAWNPGTANCGSLQYKIYRSTTSGFTPGPSNLIATVTNGSATSYSDSGLPFGSTYYYIVRAVDTTVSGDDGNMVEKSGYPTGPGGGTQTLFYDGFETNTGWTFGGGNGEWQIGTPNNCGGDYGNPDPNGAYAGTKVLGNDLTGTGSYPCDYEAYLSATYATSPVINCSGAGNVQLSFRRYLNVEQPLYDGASILASANGTSFTQIWASTATITDSAWSLQTYDISGVADGQSTVYIRFQIDKSDSSWQYSGWNIDEVTVTGYVDSPCTSGCPTANASIDSVDPSGDVCIGEAVTFSGSGTGQGTLVYEWDFDYDGNFVVMATGASPIYTFPTTGNYTVALRVTDDCTDPGPQEAIDTTTVLVLDCPPVVSYAGHGIFTKDCTDGDDVIEPGEIWSVAVSLTNTGGNPATNTTATLSISGTSAVQASILNNPGTYTTINPLATVDYIFQFSVDSGAVCVNDITFDVTGITSTEGSYPSQTPAFTVTVGYAAAGGDETASQVTDPLTVQSDNVTSNLEVTAGNGFTLTSADTATLTYDYQHSASVTETATQDTDPLNATNGASLSTLSDPFTITIASASQASVTWASLTHGSSARRCAQVELEEPGGTRTTLKSFGSGEATPYNVLTFYQTHGPGQYSIRLSESTAGNCSNGTATLTGTLMTVQGAGTGDWDSNVKVELLNPSAVATTLKDFSDPETGSYNVQPYYTGAGIYQIRLTEQGGGTAELTNGTMNVVQAGATECDLSTCGLSPEVSDDAAHHMSAEKSGNDVTLSFEDVGMANYNLYISIHAETGPFLVSSNANGSLTCDLPHSAGDPEMMTATITNLGSDISTPSNIYYFLVTADDGGTSEGPLGWRTGSIARTADASCAK